MSRRFAWMMAGLFLSALTVPAGAADGRIWSGPVLPAGAVDWRSSPPPVLPAASYFPLEPGSRWEYRVTTHLGEGDVTSSWGFGVGGWVVASNRVAYLRLEEYSFYPRLVRVTPASTVLEFDEESGKEVLWYRLGASAGTSWLTHIYDHLIFLDDAPGSQVTLVSRNEVVTVPAGTFTNVVRLDFTHPGMSRVTHSAWFAPGVGLIRSQAENLTGTSVTELVAADLGPRSHLGPGYGATLALDRPVYVNRLMPPVGPDSLPTVNALFSLRNRTGSPAAFTFTGCPSASFSVLDPAGLEVLRVRSEDPAHGCCSCSSPVDFVLKDGVLALTATFRLAGAGDRPLPDGQYTVVATLDSSDPPGQRPAASLVIEIQSIH